VDEFSPTSTKLTVSNDARNNAGELMRSPDTYSLLVRGTKERREGTVREVKGIPQSQGE